MSMARAQSAVLLLLPAPPSRFFLLDLLKSPDHKWLGAGPLLGIWGTLDLPMYIAQVVGRVLVPCWAYGARWVFKCITYAWVLRARWVFQCIAQVVGSGARRASASA